MVDLKELFSRKGSSPKTGTTPGSSPMRRRASPAETLAQAHTLLRQLRLLQPGDPEAFPVLNECTRLGGYPSDGTLSTIAQQKCLVHPTTCTCTTSNGRSWPILVTPCMRYATLYQTQCSSLKWMSHRCHRMSGAYGQCEFLFFHVGCHLASGFAHMNHVPCANTYMQPLPLRYCEDACLACAVQLHAAAFMFASCHLAL